MESKQNLKMQIRKIIINQQGLKQVKECISEIFSQYDAACNTIVSLLKQLEQNTIIEKAINDILDEKDDEDNFNNYYVRR